ncbi:hypothetical protein ACFQ46_09900 [Kineococcus sp. GCM10028916]|uniref:hypothetical protein n=1 Tax=Kineococcus sp. GCM10028916 TaxID=3273394 RepID=UPI00363BE09D
MGGQQELTARFSTALLVLPLLLSALLLAGGSEQLLLGTAVAVASSVVVGLLALRGVVAELLAAVAPSPPVARFEPADTLPQNAPAAVGNPQPRAPGVLALPC